MKTRSKIGTRRWTWRTRAAFVVVAVVLIAVPLAALPVCADSGTANVTVTAANAAKISLSISDQTADFGSDLVPEGTITADGENVVGFAQTGTGSYYVWKSVSDAGTSISVKSNRAWAGTVVATENPAAASWTVASGALRWLDSLATTYAEAAGYNAFSTAAAAWPSAGSQPRGVNTYTNYYSLRVSWGDGDASFNSTVTYAVSN